MAYLKSHSEISSFVILDDKTFDYEIFPNLWNRLILTKGIDRSSPASNYPDNETLNFLHYLTKK